MSEPFEPPPPFEPPGTPPTGSPPPSNGGDAAGNPWDRRDRLGFVNALIEAVKIFVTNPTEAFESTRRSGDYVGPLIFAIVIGWVMAIIGQIWGLLFGGAMIMPLIPAEMRDQMGQFFAASGAQVVITLVLYPLLAAIGIFLVSGILHVCLMLVGGTGDSESGFEGSFRTVCFASVASLAQIVPFVGGFIAFVWTIFLWVIGLSTLHRTTQGKALLAVLIPVLICCICLILAFFGSVATIVGMANR